MRRALVALIVAIPLVMPIALTAQADFVTLRFERYLDALRRQAGIPGLAAAIVQDDGIAWEAGFGYQDIEASIPASPDTPFYVADLTSTLSATLVLQCVEEGKARFNQLVTVPASARTARTSVTIRELLSHSPAGGDTFRYEPERFAALSGVIERCTEDSLKEAFVRRILGPLAMTRSVPGQDVVTVQPSDFTSDELEGYASVLRQIAKPYHVDRRGRASLSQYPATTLDAASGLISTVRDLASFSVALDTLNLLDENTLAAAWAVPHGTSATRSKFGLGWFVQVYNGQPVVWHFGYLPDASSALFIHLPARHKSLILLANSDGLAAAFSLPNGDVTLSPYARLFLSLFG